MEAEEPTQPTISRNRSLTSHVNGVIMWMTGILTTLPAGWHATGVNKPCLYKRNIMLATLQIHQLWCFIPYPRQHIGGCLWYSFDHQRGYHPDPFYGGVMDVFRQPKYSYYMFMSQRSPRKEKRLFKTGPMVYIAHEMTPFSGKDVTVYSNCDEVRLTYLKVEKHKPMSAPRRKKGCLYPIITFKTHTTLCKTKHCHARANRPTYTYWQKGW